MAGFSGSYSHQAGDCFYFEGGVTWPNSSFPMHVVGGGTASASDYYGPDYSWYAGGSWSRPVFSASGQTISGPANEFVDLSGISYVTFDNIEFTDFSWTNSPSWATCQYILADGGATNLTFENLYMHGWTHSGGATDDCFLILGDINSPYNAGSVIENTVFDGADSTNGGDAMTAAKPWEGSFIDNICNDLPNCMLSNGGPATQTISGNLCENLQISFTGEHENCFESTNSNPTTFYISNDVIENACNGCEPMFLGNTGETDYVWNNVIWGTGNSVDLDPGGNGAYYFNNTIEGSYEGQCFRLGTHGSLGSEPVELINNHCINDTSLHRRSSNGGSNITLETNLLQTHAAASAPGLWLHEHLRLRADELDRLDRRRRNEPLL